MTQRSTDLAATTGRIAPPHRALWEITRACDLRCEHCLVEGGPTGADELDAAAALDLVDQLAALGVRAISLTGGEPLLRPDWPAIANRVRERGMILRFASNGHMLDRAALRTLIGLGTELFAVSVDGLEATHNSLRHGPGIDDSFSRVMAAIELLRESPIAIQVFTSVSRQNIHELPQIHALLRPLGIKFWTVQLAHATGRLATARPGARCRPIAPEQLPQVARFIAEHADDPLLQPRAFHSIGYLSSLEPIIRGSGHRRGHPLWRGCPGGIRSLGIEPNGDIKGCANQVNGPFIVGNVRREPLREIWQDRRRWVWLDPTPDRMTGACAACALNQVCQAGCTALAWGSSGELFNNPYCLRRIEREQARRD